MKKEETRLRELVPRDEIEFLIREATVPSIGDIRADKRYQKEIWSACEKCGKKRWVRLLRGEPRNTLCNACARDKKIERHCRICGEKFKVHGFQVTAGVGFYCSSECRKIAQSRRMSGDKHPMWRGGKIKRVCEECGCDFEVFPCTVKVGRGKFCSPSCNMVNQRKRGMFCQTPNGIETALIALLEKNGLPFKYTGNGEVWFGNRNPDFINTDGRKQAIELFGTYWHPVFDVANRTEHYKQYGIDCLVIWEDELANPPRLIQKIKRFANAR